MSGTSQATAFATGIAALLMSQDERMSSPEEVIKHLTEYLKPVPTLKQKIRGGGVVNARVSPSMDWILSWRSAANRGQPQLR